MAINLIQAIKIVLPEKPGKTRDYLEKFKDALAADIAKIDALIEAYNKTSTDKKRLQALAALEALVQQIDGRYPDDAKSFYPDYHEKIHKNLFKAIQAERAALDALPDEATLSFPEYLAIMDPEKADQLLRILLEPDFTQEKLENNLFSQGETGRDVFVQILSRYKIESFAGRNSKNFTVFDTQTNKRCILKVDNRMSLPKDAVTHLRKHSLKDVFTPDTSEREVMCINPVDGKRATRTLLFTELHQSGDLKQDATRHNTVDEKCDTAIYRYLQMARILEGIERDGCCFTDMKNANWLIDAFGDLRIADKKAFLYTQKKDIEVEDRYGDRITHSTHVLDLTDEKNKFYSLLRSRHMCSQELDEFDATKPPLDMNKMHAYMLGKNLYQYLTNCSDRFFVNVDAKGEVVSLVQDVEHFDFSADVFKTARGVALKHTIKQLMNPDVDARMSLHDAVESLAFIEYPDLLQFSFDHEALVDLKIDTYQLLKSLDVFKLNSEDHVITAFMTKQREAIKAADSEESLLTIQAELNVIRSKFRENHDQFLAIKDMIRDFKADASPEVVKKGAKIEVAFLSVPLLLRASIADGKTKSQQAVLDAMDSDTDLFGRLMQIVCFSPSKPATSDAFLEKFSVFKQKVIDTTSKQDDKALDNKRNMSPK